MHTPKWRPIICVRKWLASPGFLSDRVVSYSFFLINRSEMPLWNVTFQNLAVLTQKDTSRGSPTRSFLKFLLSWCKTLAQFCGKYRDPPDKSLGTRHFPSKRWGDQRTERLILFEGGVVLKKVSDRKSVV